MSNLTERAKARRIKVYENRDELLDAIGLIARAAMAGLGAAKTLDELGIESAESAELVDTFVRSHDLVCCIVGVLEFAVERVEQEQADAE